jgi:very-short-patch-repair endonuclease
VLFSLRLVIEVDGPSRELMPARVRTRRLEVRGYRVIRFSNHQVMRDLDAVVETIRAVIAEMAANSNDMRDTARLQ